MLGRAVDLPQLAGSADELRASLTSLTRFGLEKIEVRLQIDQSSHEELEMG